MSSQRAHFPPALFEFLVELRHNNNREWFLANKRRYETLVKEPALGFISDIGPRLQGLSPHLVADPRPVGGSLFRINRDIRFSADKSPYKTAVGMSFGHDRGREDAAPGLYLHLAPGESFGGGGVHMPEPPTLKRIRDAIVAEPDRWHQVVSDPGFAPAFESTGDALKRAPQGYDPGHRHVEDLKRKSYVWHVHFSEPQVCAAGFMDRYVDACRAAGGFNRFLADALGVAW
ncbi:MAG: TIGR02453 family protein [Candidatus Dormiibacterota bacterium]